MRPTLVISTVAILGLIPGPARAQSACNAEEAARRAASVRAQKDACPTPGMIITGTGQRVTQATYQQCLDRWEDMARRYEQVQRDCVAREARERSAREQAARAAASSNSSNSSPRSVGGGAATSGGSRPNRDAEAVQAATDLAVGTMKAIFDAQRKRDEQKEQREREERLRKDEEEREEREERREQARREAAEREAERERARIEEERRRARARAERGEMESAFAGASGGAASNGGDFDPKSICKADMKFARAMNPERWEKLCGSGNAAAPAVTVSQSRFWSPKPGAAVHLSACVSQKLDAVAAAFNRSTNGKTLVATDGIRQVEDQAERMFKDLMQDKLENYGEPGKEVTRAFDALPKDRRESEGKRTIQRVLEEQMARKPPVAISSHMLATAVDLQTSSFSDDVLKDLEKAIRDEGGVLNDETHARADRAAIKAAIKAGFPGPWPRDNRQHFHVKFPSCGAKPSP